MVYRRIASFSQRDEAFWIGLTLWIVGGLTSESLHIGMLGVSEVLLISGTSILAIRVIVGVLRILRIALKSYKTGYNDGRRSN